MENLCIFLMSIKAITTYGNTDYMSHEKIEYYMSNISEYIDKNISVINNTGLLNEKDFDVIAYSINEIKKKLEMTNNKLEKIDIHNE